jgi:HPt (histidine-containing phosphotransfer) domain-containing protein
MDSIGQNALTEALDRMWAQYLPQMEERVAILEASAEAFAARQLSLSQHEAAKGAAHKLAGVLGTFGLTRGTVLAREAEILYSGEPEDDPSIGPRLTSIAAQLKVIVASRK